MKRKNHRGLKKLREIQGLTKIDLSKRAGVAVKTIQNIELRAKLPSLTTLTKLAKALDCPVEWLL